MTRSFSGEELRQIKRFTRVKFGLAAGISVLTFLVFLPALRHDFVEWDDDTYVVNNPYIRSLSPAFFKWAFSDFYAANWHPLTWISHALDYAVWGLNPLGHHLTNNILHAINTFLVVVLVVRLLEAADSRFTIHDSPFALIAAATTGLLFGIHPIHVESVAWVAERKDLLCALFFLLSIMMYVRYATPLPPSYLRRGPRSRGSYLLSLTFFILALLSKPMAVSLPAVLLLLDWYPFNRITTMRTFRTAFIEKLPFIAFSLASSVLTVAAQKAGGTVVTMEEIPLPLRMLVSVKSLIAYLWKMIAPVDLLPFYPYPNNASLLSAEYILPIILVTGITAACIFLSTKEKLWLSVWLYYLLTLVPVLGIVQVGSQAMADRYTYLPGLGPFLVAGLMTAWTHKKLRTSTKQRMWLRMGSMAAVSVLLLLMSYATIHQIGVWRDGVALWTYVIEKEPPKVPRAYLNLGAALKGKGRIDEAAAYYRIAIRLDPTDANAHNNLGVVLNSKGLYDTAIEEFRIAMGLKPNFAEPHFNLGMLYLDSGAVDKAREEFDAGLKIKPDDPRARQILNEIMSK